MPEYESVEAFVEFLLDEDRTSFNHADLGELAFQLQRSRSKIRAELEEYGLMLSERPFEKKVRGFTSNNHNRWHGNPCGGGTGWEQINGFAGQAG